MKTFKDLDFREHSISKSARETIKKMPDMKKALENMLGQKQAVLAFDNGLTISVLLGSHFYSNGTDTYEAWCEEIDSDPRGYLSKEEVENYMNLIESKVRQ